MKKYEKTIKSLASGKRTFCRISDDKIAPCVCDKDISSAFSCESAPGADADAEYSLPAGGDQSERNLQQSVYQTVYGDGIPATNGKSSF